MSKFRVISVVIATVLVLLAGLPAAATPAPAGQAAPAASQEAPGAFLTGPNQGDAQDIALAFLQQAAEGRGLAAGDLSDLVVTDRYTTRHNGVTHIYLRQRLGGIEVFGANVNINIAADGSVISMGEALIPGLSKAVNTDAPSLSAAQAVDAAAASLGLKLNAPLEVMESSNGADQAVLFSDGGISLEPIPAKLVYQPVADGAVRLAWNVRIYQLDALHWWDMRVDALDGKVLDQFDYVISDDFGGPAVSAGTSSALAVRWNATLAQQEAGGGSYEVYAAPAESPSHGSRSIVTDPATVAASPYGWHDTNGAAGAEFTTTQGNNAHAYTDTDNNNSADSGSSPSGTASLTFNFSLDLAQAPSTYRPAAVTNLFYWNNLVHDVMHRYGFDEPGGNFQENNYGHGGSGSDYVYAEAQDGGGTNNANFATPTDGGNPRMQMYLWTQTSPQRDGDFDNGIIVHEYGHGISTRLTGGPANSSCLNNQEQGGEGWSDYFGILMTIEPGDAGTNRRGVGTYVLGESTTGDGIRDYPYSTDMAIDPRTYDAIKTAAVPHGVGSTWAAMVWEMTWALIDQYGFSTDLYGGTGGNNKALQLVIDGLKLQPCSPGFVDARNAILQADQVNNSGANQCLLWTAFAKRGLGYSATQGSSNNRSDGVQAFDVPLSCQQTLKITKSANPSSVTAGGLLTYSLLVENQTAGALSNVQVTDTVPAGTTYVNGSATCGGSLTGGVVTFNLGTMAAGASQTCTFQVTVDGGLGTVTFFSDNMESSGGAWSATAVSGANLWSRGTTSAHSPTHAWFVQDITTSSEQLLTQVGSVTLSGAPVLSFWHSHNTEANWDGGVVEISNNGGASWTDLGSLMTQNGYTGTFSSGSGPLAGRQGFLGNSNGYKETRVNLNSFAGQTVRIRFRFTSDSSVGATGWYVDDVQIADVDSLTNTACVNASGGQNDCDTIETVVLPGSGGDDPPTVTITNPTNGSTVVGAVTITADATDDIEVTQLEFFVDSSSIGVDTDGGDGWSMGWNTTAQANGSHAVSAVATDTSSQTGSNSVNVTVDNPTGPADVIYVSSSTDGTAGGVVFADEDILSYNAGAWSMVFDGSDVGVTVDLNAFDFQSDGSILMSFDTAASIAGVGTVDDSDIVRFTGTLGNTTTGTFSLYFDGSDVGLTTTAEDIDALDVLSDGRLVISTEGSFSVTGASGADEDLAVFTATSTGSTTAGTWALYFDGSDVGLSTSSSEDVNGLWSAGASGPLYLSTLGAFSVTGVSGDGADIFVCQPSSLGNTTTCTFSMYWDGSANGFAGEVLDGVSIVQ